MSRCPAGFINDGGKCYKTCPEDFKYVDQKCVSNTNRDYWVRLNGLPPLVFVSSFTPFNYLAEQKRVDTELNEVREKLKTPPSNQETAKSPPSNEETAKSPPSNEETAKSPPSNEENPDGYSGDSKPATFRRTGDVIKEVSDSLTPFRPPTAPASDIEKERRAILNSSAPSMLLIHTALFSVVLCLLAYAFIPVEYAHWISFVVLSMAVAIGIFLWK